MTPQSGGVSIVEDNTSGHRLSYVATLADYAVRSGREVTICLPAKGWATPEAQVHLSGIHGRVGRYNLSATASPEAIRSLAQHLNSAVVIIPDGDSLLASPSFYFTRIRHTQVNVLIMREPQTLSWRDPGSIKSMAKKWALRIARRKRGVSIYTLTSALSPTLRTDQVPDPITLTTNVDLVRSFRETHHMRSEIIWVGVVGGISARKNVGIIAQALTLIPGRSFGLLLAGRVDPAYRAELAHEVQILKNRGIPIVHRDETLSTADLDTAIAAVDVIALAHSNEGPSGILGKAVAASTPVVAAGATSLRRDVAGLKGSIWVPLQANAIAKAFSTIEVQAAETDFYHDGDLFARRLLQGSSEDFSRTTGSAGDTVNMLDE